MIKRLISACIVVILSSCLCGCAQTAEDAFGAERENKEKEDAYTGDGATDGSEEGKDVGAAGELKDITWDQVELNVLNLHFVFEDTVIDREIVGQGVDDIVYQDITGDGVEETLIYCGWANNICDWQLIYFYQVGHGIVTDISPTSEDIPELDDADPWNMWWPDAETMEGYSSPIYPFETYYKAHDGITYPKETLYVGYKDGKWELVKKEGPEGPVAEAD